MNELFFHPQVHLPRVLEPLDSRVEKLEVPKLEPLEQLEPRVAKLEPLELQVGPFILQRKGSSIVNLGLINR